MIDNTKSIINVGKLTEKKNSDTTDTTTQHILTVRFLCAMVSFSDNRKKIRTNVNNPRQQHPQYTTAYTTHFYQ